MLEPNKEMNEYINETMYKIGITKGRYTVIHIRSGDIYLDGKSHVSSKSKYFKKIHNEVYHIISKNKNMDYLLLADNNDIKTFLCNSFSNIKVIYNVMTHLGEGKVLERQKVKDTMLDFYLLANAVRINAFTTNFHGTGFSLWCAKTYNIPYCCKYIKNKT